MPNWCYNVLTIEGDENSLQEFKQRNKSHNRKLSLNKLVPLPAKEKNNWYEWQIANWGTKWDLDTPQLQEYRNPLKLVYDFDSAWSPPVDWLKKVAKIFPELHFTLEYEESGAGFQGIAETTTPGEISDKTEDYVETEEDE